MGQGRRREGGRLCTLWTARSQTSYQKVRIGMWYQYVAYLHSTSERVRHDVPLQHLSCIQVPLGNRLAIPPQSQSSPRSTRLFPQRSSAATKQGRLSFGSDERKNYSMTHMWFTTCVNSGLDSSVVRRETQLLHIKVKIRLLLSF